MVRAQQDRAKLYLRSVGPRLARRKARTFRKVRISRIARMSSEETRQSL